MDFKRSLWYGMKDIGRSLLGQDHSLDALRKDEFWAVKDISFEVRRGECLGLIGHNGAGKSTLLKMLNGLINPDQGKITMRGRVGALIELGAGFNPVLTGRENVYNNGAVLGFTKKEINEKFNAIVEFSEIGEFIDSPVQNYSSGMKVRLGFAVAAQLEPDILLIDEVLAVGDVGFRLKCINTIGYLMYKSAVIFVSHSMIQIFRVSTSIMLMKNGTVFFNSNEVGKGIEQYFNMFENNKINISGSGEAELLSFSIKKLNQQINIDETPTVKQGDTMHIYMQLKLNRKIDIATVQLIIWNQELIPVLNILDENRSAFKFKSNQLALNEIKLSIPNINLNAGLHKISVVVHSSDFRRTYCRYDNIGSFNMSSNFVSGANVIIPSIWQVINRN